MIHLSSIPPQTSRPTKRVLSFLIFIVAAAALLLELTLIRVFDVLWYPHMAFMVITLAMFAFGLAGVYLSIRPKIKETLTTRYIATLVSLMVLSTLAVIPVINAFKFDFSAIGGQDTPRAVLNFFIIYSSISIPFFISGLILSSGFSAYAGEIRRLYCWDLIGASLGCLLIIPLLPPFGTVGLIVIVAAMGLLALAILLPNWLLRCIPLAAAIGLVAVVVLKDGYYDFSPHMDKRGLATLMADQGFVDGSWWDPISKIDVVRYPKKDAIRWIAYDGGSQTSYFYKFDGDYAQLRDQLPDKATSHFWGRGVLVSHFLKQDTDQEVLIIGSAGGQEAKAALVYGAKHVDGIELVGKVVELGKGKYNEFIGGVMNAPQCNIQKGEGRSFLRSCNKKFDIIQLNSNHTSSSIAAGSGALSATYLQTTDAYKEYFTHLTPDGILHINHHIYPRMLLTAAKAWRELGLNDFKNHVLVLEVPESWDNLPTFLVKMSPWTGEEVSKIRSFMNGSVFAVNPYGPAAENFLSDAFFSGELPAELEKKIPYNISATTDDRPFFNHLIKTVKELPDEDRDAFVNMSVSGLLNSRLQNGLPRDIIHLVVTSGAALVFAAIFTIVPLLFSRTGQEKWQGKGETLLYFSCIGMGFIIFELISIQVFMKLIGYPLYTYTVVVFTYLIGAGIGSVSSEMLQLFERRRYFVCFIGIILSALVIAFGYQVCFAYLLALGTFLRSLCAVLFLFPLTFFLGMAFPLGILSTRDKPAGTVAWAWAFNGLFTVIGSITAVILSLYLGFRNMLLFAICCYIIAMVCSSRMMGRQESKKTARLA